MDAQYQNLPPLKRLRLMQRDLELAHQQHQLQSQPEVKPSQLPAKKRKHSRVDYDDDCENSSPAYRCLPAKKRIWAIDPDLLSGTPFSPFDLNVEYTPCVDEDGIEKKKNPSPLVESESNPQEDDDDKENIDPLSIPEDEDGIMCGVCQSTDGDPSNPIVFCDGCDLMVHASCYGNPLVKAIPEGDWFCSLCTESTSLKKNPSPLVESNPQEEDDKENIDPLGEDKALDLSDSIPEGEDGIMCAVCQSTDGDPSNPIVFCDGCDLMVHASCYGNPLVKAIPEGDWFCSLCTESTSLKKREKPFSCCLCTTKGGAMKPTKDGRWAHITCSLFVPEVYFEDPEGREGICCSEIPSKRWKERCYLCKVRRGCVIECSEMKCELAFHVTCGLKEDLCIEYREGKRSGGIVVGFCSEHTKLWERQQESGKYKIVARD